MAAVKVAGYKVLEPVKYNGECLEVGAKIRAAEGDEEQPGTVDQVSIDDLLAMNAIEPAEWLDETEETAGTEKTRAAEKAAKAEAEAKAKAEAEAKAKAEAEAKAKAEAEAKAKSAETKTAGTKE